MKLKLKKISLPADMMRRAGYIFQHRTDNEMSFVRPYARSGYPRFHVYLSEQENMTLLNIHLDQKKETYGKSTRHHGEYEDDGALHEEVERIKGFIGQDVLLA